MSVRYLLLGLFLSPLPAWAQDKQKKQPDDKKIAAKIKEVAGSAEFLRAVPKHFATLLAIDAKRHEVTLLVEGEAKPKVWPLVADAEIKVAGWWGRLEDLPMKGRVWVWLKIDRKKQPIAISMIADEMSQQHINGSGVKFQDYQDGKLTHLTAQNKPRSVSWDTKVAYKKGELIYLQTEAGRIRELLDQAGFERRLKEQRSRQRIRWEKEGLPGTAAFIHTFSGEMDLMLDHETMRWARSLEKGDAVILATTPPTKAIVKSVAAWRERTQVRLVVRSIDLADLAAGQRLHLLRTPPSEEVDSSPFPPDIDGVRGSKQERIDWFLANIYCTCKVGGDGCTGHFYTLASCNPNACGMPNFMRKTLNDKIDEGKTDRVIFEELSDRYGPTLTRPHLLP